MDIQVLEKVLSWYREIFLKSDIERKVKLALNNVDEAERFIGKEKWEQAFNHIAYAKYYLMNTDVYRVPLLDAIDDVLDELWDAWQGRKASVSRMKKKISTIRKLIKNPRGEMEDRPTRVKTKRDARLWEMAKRIAEDQYGFEDETKYWKVTSRIFTRMKYRLGGRPEKEVEQILEELKEEKDDE